MNNIRRKEIRNIIEKLEELESAIIELKEQEEEALNNMPENLEGSEKYQKIEEALGYLEEAEEAIDEARDNLENATA